MQLLKVSTAVSCIVGPILDSTGVEYGSAVIGDISLSKNGGTLTALASAATLTYIANGLYTLALTTGNTDTLGRAEIFCNKSTYQMPPVRFQVLPATTFDAIVTNAAGAANGLPICGSNAATTFATLTVTGATTLTGNVALAAGLTITQSTTNGHGISSTGNGTGHGIYSLSGTGAAACGVKFESQAGSGLGNGIWCVGVFTGDGLHCDAGATGRGIHGVGGATSGEGMRVSGTAGNSTGMAIVGQGSAHGLLATGGSSAGSGAAFAGGTGASGLRLVGSTTGSGMELIAGASGVGLKVTTTAGDGVNITATGASAHGVVITGGNSGTSDGLKLVAGTGGVGFRLDTLTASGAITLSSTLTVTGIVTASNASNNIVGIDVAKLGGGAQSLADLKDFADTGYDPATHKVQGVVLVDTLTTYTGNTPQTGNVYGYLTSALTESYAADGATFTMAQGLYEICQTLSEFAIASTTITVKKRDGTTTAMTYTLDSATTPTSRTRAT